MMEVREILPSLEQVNRSEHGVVIEPGPSRPLEEPTRPFEVVQAIPTLEKVSKAIGEPPRPPEPPALTKVEPEKPAIPELVKVTTERVPSTKPEAGRPPRLDLKEIADSVQTIEKQATVTPPGAINTTLRAGVRCQVLRKPAGDEELRYASEEGASWVGAMDKYLGKVGVVHSVYEHKVALSFGKDDRAWWFLKSCICLENESHSEYVVNITQADEVPEVPELKKVEAKKTPVVVAQLSYVVVGFHHGTGEFDLLGTTTAPNRFLYTCSSTLSSLFGGQFAGGQLVREAVPDSLKELGVCARCDLVDRGVYPIDENAPVLKEQEYGEDEERDVDSLPSWNRSDTSISYTWILIASQAGEHVKLPLSQLEAVLY